MRPICIFIIILAGICFAQAQENKVFYYYKEERIYLDKIKNIKVIHFNKTLNNKKY